eukprot:434785_1
MAFKTSELETFLANVNLNYVQYASVLSKQGVTPRDISWMAYDDCKDFGISLIDWIQIVAAAKQLYGGWKDDGNDPLTQIEWSQWTCSTCTYSNANDAAVCGMCGAPMNANLPNINPNNQGDKHNTTKQLKQELYELSNRLDKSDQQNRANQQVLEQLHNKIRIWKEKYSELNKEKRQLTKRLRAASNEKEALTEKNSQYALKLAKAIQKMRQYQTNERQNEPKNESEMVRLQININNLTNRNQKLEAENDALQMQIADDEKRQDGLGKCKKKFADWLCNTVKLQQYLPLFEQNEYNDIRMVEFLDEETLQNDIGIGKRLHCKLILKKVSEFRSLQNEFNTLLNHNKGLKQYKQEFEEHGISTLKDLQNDVKSKRELGEMIKLQNESKLCLLWDTIRGQNDLDMSERIYKEGHRTEYH